MNRSILQNSITGRDFLERGCPTKPGVDEMLDWRNQLIKLKNECEEFSKHLYDLEIEAVDEILKYLTHPTKKPGDSSPGSKLTKPNL